jgi:hypothetical protein
MYDDDKVAKAPEPDKVPNPPVPDYPPSCPKCAARPPGGVQCQIWRATNRCLEI